MNIQPTDSHGYITTQSGRRMQLPGFDARDVALCDIVHSLAMQCRYMGHSSDFYSVAEHSVKVCRLAEIDHGAASLVSRCALLHDAAEAYTGDFPSPLKRSIPELKEFEELVEEQAFAALRLPAPDDGVWAEVKKYDTMALYQEAAYLFRPAPAWADPVPYKYAHPILCLGPAEAKLLFTCKLREYGFDV